MAKGAGDATTNQEPPPRLFEIEACRRFLEALADGFTVRVVTSVCFLQPDSGSNDCFDDKTIGVFGPAMPGVIEAYLATGEWAGLPGGLAIRRLMDFWPGSFSEDPTTGYGLPMQKAAHGLKRWSISPLST